MDIRFGNLGTRRVRNYHFDGMEEVQLVQDMLDYRPNKQFRARMAYNRCRKMGHMKWAQEIDRKYRISGAVYSDTAVAFGFAMMAKR